MKRRFTPWASALIAASLAGCPVCLDEGELRLLAGDTTLGPSQTAQFEYYWNGQLRSTPGDCGGVWVVDGVVGGSAEVGTVDGCGLYTAPETLSAPRAVTLLVGDYAPGECHDCCPYVSRTLRLVPGAPSGDGGL